MINTVTTNTNSNVVVVTAPGPSGPIGPQGPIGDDGTITSNSGTIITPRLEVSGSAVITGSLIVSGSSTFRNIGPAFFTGSTAVLGNFAVNGTSSATVFSGSGAYLSNIPASGITGLNLSRIAVSTVSASVSTGGTAFTLNNGGTSLFTVSNVGAGTFANGLVVSNGTTSLTGTATLNGADILTSETVSTNRITDSNISASVSSTGKPFTVTDNTTELFSVDSNGLISGSGLNLSSDTQDTVIDTPNITLVGNATLNGQAITTAGDLTLNQIKSGAVTASVSTGTNSFTVESSGNTLFTVSNTGAVTVSQSINIGRAEDGDYTDGLYTDINSDTTVGTMVDRFNEILKGLSPAPAPDLDNFESVDVGTNNQQLAFGASQPTSSYINVTGTGSRAAADFTSTYSRTTGPGGRFTRLGVFSATTTIDLVLNEDVSADGSPFTNYSASAFNVPVNGGESYTLEINGATYTETPTGTGSLNGTYFDLTSADTGFFPATGLPFAIFRNRRGTVDIPAALWQNGWNYAKVRQGNNVTNYVDWVYDPASAPGNFPYTFTGFETGSVTPTGQKNLSGIKYYTGFSYRVTGTIGNLYKNVYTRSNNTTFAGSNLNITAVTVNNPDNADSTVPVNSLHTFTGTRLLGTTLSSTLTVNNSFSKTGNTGAITTPTILLDNVNTANSNTQENFCLEDRRVPLASYDTQTSVTDAIGTFTSDSPLGSSDLAVYAGTLRYPTQVLNSGNVLGAGVVYAIANQPNYSGVTEDRWFFRVFRNGTGAVATFNVSISGTNINFTTFGGTLTTNAVKIWIKIPGKTGWRDALTPAPGSTAGIETNDNVGCLNGSAPSNITSQATRNIGINMVTEGLGASEYFMVRVQASSGWTGTINQINFSGL